MGKSARLRSSDIRSLFRIAGECRDLGDDPTTWRAHWFALLARFTGADLVCGGEKAGVLVGTGRTIGVAAWGFEHGFDPTGWERSIEAYARNPDYSPAESRYLDRVRAEGEQALARSDVMADREWDRSPDYQDICRVIGINHLTWSNHRIGPASADEHSAILVMRAIGAPDFSAREKALIQASHDLIAPLVGGALAAFADPAPTDLTPAVRRVLRSLLEGDSEKQIAARLGISRHTVSEYVQRIYRHFRVTSRPELMARWLKRGWASRCAWDV